MQRYNVGTGTFHRSYVGTLPGVCIGTDNGGRRWFPGAWRRFA